MIGKLGWIAGRLVLRRRLGDVYVKASYKVCLFYLTTFTILPPISSAHASQNPAPLVVNTLIKNAVSHLP